MFGDSLIPETMANPPQSDAERSTPQAASEPTEQALIAWEAREFMEYDRSKPWYIAAVVIGLAFVVGALLLQQ